MLRITTSDIGEKVTLKLEGKLSGPWVEELDRCWRMSSHIYNKQGLVVDLSGVTFVDPAGKKLLCSIAGGGAQLVGSGLMPKSLIDEICVEKNPEKPSKAPHKLKQEVTHLLLILLLPLLAASRTRAEDAAPLRLTLRDAVATALKENPQVQIATLSFAESQEDKSIARSALLPQAGLEVLDRAIRVNLYAEFGSKFPGIPEHAGPFQFFQAGPGVTMPLLDLTLWRRLQAARQGMSASQAQETTVREQLVLLVVSQYLAGMRATAAVQAAQSRVDLAQALYDQANDLQQHGVGTGIDTLRANVELQNEKQRLLEAQTQQKVALFGLTRLLNLEPQRQIELADTPNFYATPQIDANQSLEQAYETRPEMKALAAQAHMAELAKRAASESRLPTINFAGTWGEQGLSAPSSIPAYIYQVTVDVPIFTGGRIHAEIAKADLEIKKVEQERADLRNQIALEVKTSQAQLEAAQHEVDVANLGVKLAQEEVSQARDRFQAGVANNIEVVSAQDALARANDNQIAALYGYNQSRADLSHAIGQIEGLYSK
ncbi:MAG: TolC family protein [Terriglobia bacterium]|jgi:outer membrane protein TolC/ABC-type transporter Mla MlaB component